MSLLKEYIFVYKIKMVGLFCFILVGYAVRSEEVSYILVDNIERNPERIIIFNGEDNHNVPEYIITDNNIDINKFNEDTTSQNAKGDNDKTNVLPESNTSENDGETNTTSEDYSPKDTNVRTTEETDLSTTEQSSSSSSSNSGSTKPFNVYWNVPTDLCSDKKRIPRVVFANLYEKYGIIQNAEDKFDGEKITILYDPGHFPALFINETGSVIVRNGGVPQEGDLSLHHELLRKHIEQKIPDKSYSGIAVIDFEEWRPVFRQHFNVQTQVINKSLEIEAMVYWADKELQSEGVIKSSAKERFEKAAREFMEGTLLMAKEMRPGALWGYYGFPYCFNMNSYLSEDCDLNVTEENDRINWLWSESKALYPSVYASKVLTSSQMAGLIRGRVAEAARVNKKGLPVLPYFYFRHLDGGYLSKKKLQLVIKTLYISQTSGFIIWGSSKDVNTPEKCKSLLEYVTKHLGPAIAKYTKLSSDKYLQETENSETDEGEEENVNKNEALRNDLLDNQSNIGDTEKDLENKEFSAYWNVPTRQCTTMKISFGNLLDTFGIRHNSKDDIMSEQVIILYDPGQFPALIEDKSGNIISRNGGIPQAGSLKKHEEEFIKTIEKMIPDKNFSGLGVISFDKWRPILRQHFNDIPIRNHSIELEIKLSLADEKSWTSPEIEDKAQKRFEESAKEFILNTLLIAKEMRPRARWGYYGFPFCYNMNPSYMLEDCPEIVKGENERINWLWSESTALYPNMYGFKNLTPSQLAAFVRGRVAEAARIKPADVPVLPYIKYRYDNDTYLSQEDLKIVLETLYTANATGFIIWGSSKDVNTVDKCENLLKYTTEVLGPIVANYTRHSRRTNNSIDSVITSTTAPLTVYEIVTLGGNATNTIYTIDKTNIQNGTDLSGIPNLEQTKGIVPKDIHNNLKNQTNEANDAKSCHDRETTLQFLVSEIKYLRHEMAEMQLEITKRFNDITIKFLNNNAIAKSLQDKENENTVLISQILDLQSKLAKLTTAPEVLNLGNYIATETYNEYSNDLSTPSTNSEADEAELLTKEPHVYVETDLTTFNIMDTSTKNPYNPSSISNSDNNHNDQQVDEESLETTQNISAAENFNDIIKLTSKTVEKLIEKSLDSLNLRKKSETTEASPINSEISYISEEKLIDELQSHVIENSSEVLPSTNTANNNHKKLGNESSVPATELYASTTSSENYSSTSNSKTNFDLHEQSVESKLLRTDLNDEILNDLTSNKYEHDLNEALNISHDNIIDFEIFNVTETTTAIPDVQ